MKEFDWKSYKTKEKERTQSLKEKISVLKESSGINKLLDEIRRIEKEINKQRNADRFEFCKNRIDKGQTVTLTGGPIDWLNLFNKIKGKVIRKNKKTATVKWNNTKFKGESWNVNYEFIELVKKK